MKTLARTKFMAYANFVWLMQFVTEFLVVQAPDVIAYEQRKATSLQVGCIGDTAAYVWSDRLFILALLWVLSASLMTVIALRFPAVWPERLSHAWWNGAASGVSLITLTGAVALMLWPISALVAMPVVSAVVVETLRGTALLITVLYYRAIVIARPTSLSSER